MKNIILLSLLFLSGLAPLAQKEDYRNFSIHDAFRLEINCGPYSSVRLFEDGMLCKAIVGEDKNGLYIKEVKFFPLSELDSKLYVKLQTKIKENNLLNYTSRIEEKYTRVYDACALVFYITKDDKLNKIVWESGKNKTLEEIINLTNELIPKGDRETFRIRFQLSDKK